MTRRILPRRLPLALAVTVGMVLASQLVTGTVASAGEQASGSRAAGSLVGFRGNELLRTNIGVPQQGLGFVHFQQVDFNNQANDFIGVGTVKGLGASRNCPDDYSSARWDVYIDGSVGGAYFCRTEQTNVYNAGSNPNFSIVARTCGTGDAGWLPMLGGSTFECITNGLTAAPIASAALETTCNLSASVCATDRNIDVTFSNLNVYHDGGWDVFGYPYPHIDPSYQYTSDTTTFTPYKAPLD